MTLGENGADLGFDHAIIHHFAQLIAQIDQVFHRQIEIDPHRLHLADLMAMHADLRRQFQVADKDMADAARGVGEFGHSDTRTSGVCQIRCWPPSTAIIWPVTASAPSR